MISKVFVSQRRNKTPKDWVTTVLSDLKEVNLDLTFEDIRKMKKETFMNTIKRKIEYKSLKYLEEIKQKHSKVEKLKHNVLQMQPYLMPNDGKIKKEECQIIFQLRSKVTDLKMNQKNRYESYECGGCGKEDESRDPVLNCQVLLEMNGELKMSEIPVYEKVIEGNIKEDKNNM